jgi:Putative auto-transporter adhesin, head GIN domain
MFRSRATIFCLSLSLAALLAASAGRADSWGFSGIAPVVNQPGHKEWVWDGEHSLSIGVPAVLHYQRGGPARIVITGPEDQLSHLRVGGGRIESEHDWSWNFSGGDERLDVTVSGVALDHIAIGGSGKLLLGHLDQDQLSLRISGSGSASAEGRVSHLALVISGSGKVDFGQVASTDAKVTISGSGNVAIAPRTEADTSISGSGMVRLATRPEHLHSAISGSGQVLLADKDGVYSQALQRVHGHSQVDY